MCIIVYNLLVEVADCMPFSFDIYKELLTSVPIFFLTFFLSNFSLIFFLKKKKINLHLWTCTYFLKKLVLLKVEDELPAAF